MYDTKTEKEKKKGGVLWAEAGDGRGERQGRRARRKAVMSALAKWLLSSADR